MRNGNRLAAILCKKVCGVAYNTVVPVMNGHPREQAKVSVHCRWPPIRGTLTLKCVGRGIDSVAIQGMCLAICYCILLLCVASHTIQ